MTHAVRTLWGLAIFVLVACGSFGTSRNDGGAAPTGPDAATPIGSTSEAGASPGSTPCAAPREAFADTFERDAPQGAWQSVIATPGVSFFIDANGVDGKALRVDVPGGTDVKARLSRGISPSTCPLRVSFAVRALTLPTEKATLFDAVYAGGKVELRMNDGNIEVVDDPSDGSAKSYLSLATPVTTLTTFTRISLTIDMSQRTVFYTLASDSNGTPKSGAVGLSRDYGAPVEVWLGADDASSTNPFSVLLDALLIQ